MAWRPILTTYLALASTRASVYLRAMSPPEASVLNVSSVVHSDPEILGGTPVFVGTRVPLQNLMDYLAAGDSLDEFLEQFPSVSREQAQAALELAREVLETSARTAR
jgi:uncharacterized protein (DUF433 family)